MRLRVHDNVESLSSGEFFLADLLILQATLLSLLILMSFLWALCCKKRCIGVRKLRTRYYVQSVVKILIVVQRPSERLVLQPEKWSNLDLAKDLADPCY